MIPRWGNVHNYSHNKKEKEKLATVQKVKNYMNTNSATDLYEYYEQ